MAEVDACYGVYFYNNDCEPRFLHPVFGVPTTSSWLRVPPLQSFQRQEDNFPTSIY